MRKFFVGSLQRRRSALLLSTASVSVALCLSLPGVAMAQEAAPANAGTTQAGDIVVTASRRSESITKLPFNISAYGAEQLERSNILNVTQLSQQVPGFTITDQGARNVEASIPVIRGMNASGFTGSAPRYAQSPVGMYQGNAPITGSIPLFDLQRVEVLRGPQGTLYGAGALAGAVRVVPNDPKLESFSGSLTAGTSYVDHAQKASTDFSGFLNVPLGENFAVRVAATHTFDAGFITQNDIMRREGNNYTNGAPILADPADPGSSRAVYFNKKGVNYTYTTAVRAAALWQPTDKLKFEITYNYARVEGNGGPVDSNAYHGGPSPIDPRVTLAPTGDYQISQASLEPFRRDSTLATFDASYDMGFATLATTLAYGHTNGTNTVDATAAILGTPTGAYYYTGSPGNPRAVILSRNTDKTTNYTEELRLVSNPGGRFDYVLGAYFQQQQRDIGLSVLAPGADVQSAGAHGGSTVPIALGGTYIPLNPDGSTYNQYTHQNFKEQSAYGELTWHATGKWQITGGARLFHQTFSQSLSQASSLFLFSVDQSNSTSKTSAIFKLNTSYEFRPGNQIYFTWSQGFRRGGANAFPVTGPIAEPTQLLNYASDKANNFELGIKGLFNGLRYSVDAFYIDWSNPQIDTVTPVNLTYVVINAKSATSKGVEAELSGPLGIKGLSFNLGFSYADAKLSQNFSLPAGDGLGNIIPNSIIGTKGDRLPNSPKLSGSLTLNYDVQLADSDSLTFSVGADYRGSTVDALPTITLPVTTAPGYALMRGGITYEHGNWQFQFWGTNLFNKRAVTNITALAPLTVALLGNWAERYNVVQPRAMGIRLTKKW